MDQRLALHHKKEKELFILFLFVEKEKYLQGTVSL